MALIRVLVKEKLWLNFWGNFDYMVQYIIQGIHVYLIDPLKASQVIPNCRRRGICSIQKKSAIAQIQRLTFEIFGKKKGHFKSLFMIICDLIKFY